MSIDSNGDAEILLQQSGLSNSSLDTAIAKEKQVQNLISSQIKENPSDQQLFDLSYGIQPDPDPNKVKQIKRMVNTIVNDSMITTPQKRQQRLVKLRSNLFSRGYSQKEIATAFKSTNNPKSNIVQVGNNIKIK